MVKNDGNMANIDEIKLLMNELCLRSMYGVRVKAGVDDGSGAITVQDNTSVYGLYPNENEVILEELDSNALLRVNGLDYVYPYLLDYYLLEPESITLKEEYCNKFPMGLERSAAEIRWCLINHVDFNGLIAKGLAIPCNDTYREVYDKLFKEGECYEKFDVSTLLPFDKVIVRDDDHINWSAAWFSHYEKNSKFPFFCMNNSQFKQCVPYNDETKYLIGTTVIPSKEYINWD